MSSHHFRSYRIGYGRKRIGMKPFAKRCNRCSRPMQGTTAYDGACECSGLIEAAPRADALAAAVTEPAQSTTQPDALAGVRAAAARSRARRLYRFG